MGRNMDTQLPERDSLDALTAISEKRAVPPEAPNQQQTNQQQQLQTHRHELVIHRCNYHSVNNITTKYTVQKIQTRRIHCPVDPDANDSVG